MGCCGGKASVPPSSPDAERDARGGNSVRVAPMQPPGRVVEKVSRAAATKLLNLSGEELQQLPPGAADGGLKGLDVSGNRLSQLDVPAGSAATLKKLSAGDNQLTTFPVSALLPALTCLTLPGNRIATVPSLAPLLPALKELNLSHNAVSSVPPDLPPLLHTLNLSHNALAVVPSCVCSLSKLSSLDVSHNRLTKLVEVEEQIRGLQQLKQLNVAHNQLTSLPAVLFTATPLTTLTLEGNSVRETDLKRMACYETWLQRRAATIDRKIQGGAEVTLIREPNG